MSCEGSKSVCDQVIRETRYVAPDQNGTGRAVGKHANEGPFHPFPQIAAELGKVGIAPAEPFLHEVNCVRRVKTDSEWRRCPIEHIDCIQDHAFVEPQNRVVVQVVSEAGLHLSAFRKFDEKDDATIVSHGCCW